MRPLFLFLSSFVSSFSVLGGGSAGGLLGQQNMWGFIHPLVSQISVKKTNSSSVRSISLKETQSSSGLRTHLGTGSSLGGSGQGFKEVWKSKTDVISRHRGSDGCVPSAQNHQKEKKKSHKQGNPNGVH